MKCLLNCITNDELFIENDELFTKNDELFTKNDEFATKVRGAVLLQLLESHKRRR